MQFFAPEYLEEPAEPIDDATAEDMLQAVRKFARETTGWGDPSDRRIYRIEYTHGGKDYVAEVGRPEPRTGELVMFILESTTYLVCTPNRGVLRELPLLIGKDEATRVEDFEE